MHKMDQILIIAGPTAVGKTKLSIALAKALDGEIMNADSMQIYRHMDIGTAKPTEDEKEGIPHHLMDFLDPGEAFNVSCYQDYANHVINDMIKRNKFPIVTGGTGFYIKSLIDPTDFLTAKASDVFRIEMENLAKKEGNEAVFRLLQRDDPKMAQKLHPNDLRRVIRALEVFHETGQPLSEIQEESKKKKGLFDPIYICLNMDRGKLYDRIDMRVDEMLKNGLLEETTRLKEMGFSSFLTASQAIGYKEMMLYLDGHNTLEEAVAILKQNTRRYAKRQLTWFRNDERVHFVAVDDFESFDELLNHILQYIQKKRKK